MDNSWLLQLTLDFVQLGAVLVQLGTQYYKRQTLQGLSAHLVLLLLAGDQVRQCCGRAGSDSR